MGSTVTYMPHCHCVIDINLGKQVTATRRVTAGDGRDYRVCDAHVGVVEGCTSVFDALRELRRQKRIGGAA